MDDNDIRSETLDVLNTYTSKGQMIDAINEEKLNRKFDEMDMAVNRAINDALRVDPNEESQNEMLRGLDFNDEVDEISQYEIETYYKNQISQDEFEKIIDNFIANNNDYDEGGTVGNSEQNAGERPEISDGEGRDQGSVSINEVARQVDQNDENKAENAPEVAGSIGNGEIDQRAAEENVERPAGITQEVPVESIEQQLKNAEADLKTKQATYN